MLHAVTFHPFPLVMPAWVFGVIALAVFATLLIACWSFRDVANRHSDKTGGAADHSDAGHGHH